MPRDMMIIINPRSGRGLSKMALGTIVGQLCNSGYIVTVYYTGNNDPGTLAYEYAKRHEIAVCVGGDGTLSSVVSGLLKAGSAIPLGYIPAGTANDVATTLALSKNPLTAVQTIIKGKPRLLDIGLFDDRYFTYVAAFGAFTGVPYKTKQSAKRALGHFAYILGGLSDMFTIKAVHTIVEYDGNLIEDDFIFGGVVNSTSVAGLVRLDPKEVDLADGLFELILVKRPISLLELLETLTSIVTHNFHSENVQLLHAAHVKFTFEEDTAWTVDGEDGGKHKTVEINNCREAISIII